MIIYKNKNYMIDSFYKNTNFTGDADFVLDDEKDAELVNKITALYPNYDFVLDNDGNLIDVVEISEPVEEIIFLKKQELSKACESAILSGVDVGDAHYSLTLEDQANILAWMAVAQTGKAVPYHCDGQPCRVYTADEFMEVANAAVAYKTHHTTYCNLLMRQVEDMTDTDEVKAVQYGMTQLEGEYAEQYQIIMASLLGNSGETNN